jgi:hypothetical protein
MTPLKRAKLASELFVRFEGNPILTAADWPYPINSVFNPGAVQVNGDVLLLNRVEDMRGFSHFCVSRSKNGLTDWRMPRRAVGTGRPPYRLARRAKAIRHYLCFIWHGRPGCFAGDHTQL